MLTLLISLTSSALHTASRTMLHRTVSTIILFYNGPPTRLLHQQNNAAQDLGLSPVKDALSFYQAGTIHSPDALIQELDIRSSQLAKNDFYRCESCIDGCARSDIAPLAGMTLDWRMIFGCSSKVYGILWPLSTYTRTKAILQIRPFVSALQDLRETLSQAYPTTKTVYCMV